MEVSHKVVVPQVHYLTDNLVELYQFLALLDSQVVLVAVLVD
jgi:hypothetical protein